MLSVVILSLAEPDQHCAQSLQSLDEPLTATHYAKVAKVIITQALGANVINIFIIVCNLCGKLS